MAASAPVKANSGATLLTTTSFDGTDTLFQPAESLTDPTGTAVIVTGDGNTFEMVRPSPSDSESIVPEITGKNGILFEGNNSTLNNTVSITTTGTEFAGDDYAVRMNGSGTVNNSESGYIESQSDAIYLKEFSTVNNSGTIKASNPDKPRTAVYFYNGGHYNSTEGSVVNSTGYGVIFNSAADGDPQSQILNSGLISGKTGGVVGRGNANGVIINQAGGTISSELDSGILISDTASFDITNYGTLSGKEAAVNFSGTGSNSLTLSTGSVLNGDVISSTADTNTLVLYETGSEDANFTGTSAGTGFKTLTMNGNDWALSGDINLTGSDESTLLVNHGQLTLSGNVTSAGNALINSGGGLLVEATG
ncbi:hypothetical protein ORG37_26685, partial [Rahnella perminowiae]|nr:hypothetical protein [Rahnella perminowiae]